MFYDHLMIVIS